MGRFQEIANPKFTFNGEKGNKGEFFFGHAGKTKNLKNKIKNI
jgi:hypothetical protein